MGTSRNDPSPRTPPWRMANALLGRPEISVPRQLQQIWRAASADLKEQLEASFSIPVLAEGCRISSEGASPTEALGAFDSAVQDSRAANLTVDIARRALVRASADQAGPLGYVAHLFSEATAYYAARDLPGLVGGKGRVDSVTDGIELKRKLGAQAVKVVETVGPPPEKATDWAGYAALVLSRLREAEK